MPKIPKDFQTLANALLGPGQTYKEISVLWDKTVQKHAPLAEKAASHPAGRAWPQSMIESFREVQLSLRDKNKRSHSAKTRFVPSALRSSGARAKSVPHQAMQRQHIQEMEVCSPEDLFFMETNGDSNPAPMLDKADFGPLATGVCSMSLSQTMAMAALYEDELFENPCAILCPCVEKQWNDLHSSANRNLVARYQPKKCSPWFVGHNPVPRMEKCMLFQFGAEHIIIDDLSAKAKVVGDIAEYVQISVQCLNLVDSKDFATKAKADFVKISTLAIGADNLHKDTVPFWTRDFEAPWKGGKIRRADGYAKVSIAKIETVLRRSGFNDVIFDLVGDTRDVYTLYNLPGTTTMVEARKHAAALKDTSYGVKQRNNCFALRIRHGEEDKVNQMLRPALHEAMGDALAALPQNEACRLILYGVPRGFSDIDVINNITFVTASGQWKCKPTGRCTGRDRCTTFGRDNIMAVAQSMPPRDTLRLDHAHEMYMVSIKPAPGSNRRTWNSGPDKISQPADGHTSRTGPSINSRYPAQQGAKFAAPPVDLTDADDSVDTFGQSRLPRPKAIAKSTFNAWGTALGMGLGTSRTAWADEEHEDDDEEDDSMRTPNDDNSALDTHSTAAASSAAVRPPTAFQKRLAELESQAQSDKVELAAIETAAAEQLATLRQETETSMMQLAEQISSIRDDMTAGLKVQAAATAALGTDLREATAASAAQFAQLLELMKATPPSAGSKQDKRNRSPSADADMAASGRQRSPRRGTGVD